MVKSLAEAYPRVDDNHVFPYPCFDGHANTRPKIIHDLGDKCFINRILLHVPRNAFDMHNDNRDAA